MSNASDSPATVARKVAELLGETDPKVLIRIGDVVSQLGAAATWRYVEDALSIQARGGLKRADGGNRTVGGIFFKLVGAKGPQPTAEPSRHPAHPRDEVGTLLLQIAEQATLAAKLLREQLP